MFTGEILSGSQLQAVLTPEGHLPQGQCLHRLLLVTRWGGGGDGAISI